MALIRPREVRHDPTVIYFESPVVVDNVTQQVLTDE